MDLKADELEKNVLEIEENIAASEILEDALQNFDTIIEEAQIADTAFISYEMKETSLEDGINEVAMLMEDIRTAIESIIAEHPSTDEQKFLFDLLNQVNDETLKFYRNMFLTEQSPEAESQKIFRLTQENEGLKLNVNILTDQVELQTEKVFEFQEELKVLKMRLQGSDERLKEELIAKTHLEKSHLEMLEEISNLKVTIATMKERYIKEEKNQKMLKLKILQLEENITKLTSNPDSKDELLDSAASTPDDEGVVINDDKKTAESKSQEIEIQHLKMPDPSATSTPSQVSPPDRGIPKFPLDLPEDKKDEGTPQLTPQPNQDRIRSKSVEKLTLLKVTPINSNCNDNSIDVSLNPNDSIGSCGANKSTSTPNLASNLRVNLSETKNIKLSKVPPIQPTSSAQRKKNRFKKLFSFKLRRSFSTSLDDEKTSNHKDPEKSPTGSSFLRGGMRSTIGSGRNGWNKLKTAPQPKRRNSTETNFAAWSVDEVTQWLIDIGLGLYANQCANWLNAGNSLMQATNHDLEKQLGIRNSIHKKKLALHLQCLSGDDDVTVSGAIKMNSVCVARWLDDIGLPQYKDSFNQACVDGLLLHHLTVGDVNKLGVTNLFHLLSLRRAIDVLRSCDFDVTSLLRRPAEDDQQDKKLELWTNHRVMEWLRTIDLAEYAPNLRGSGVHGAVMVKESNFNGETLAWLLHIPQNKTLLRRHLAAKLTDLLPSESVEAKKARCKMSGYQQMNITAKYKIGRRSFASAFGRSSTRSAGQVSREFSSGEYVSPIPSSAKTMERHRSILERKIQVKEIHEKRSREDVEDASTPNSLNESTTRELNAFSTQLNFMTEE